VPTNPSDTPLFERRRALKLMGAASLVAVATACGASNKNDSEAATSSTSGPSTTSGSRATASSGTATPIPEETAGPYPGDGSNGPNVLTQDGVVRSDIRSSFGSMSGTAEGVPLKITLTVLDAGTGGALAGAAVYAWHCDREGRYSLYSQGATEQNYLRGVQQADANGAVTFTSIFPACYAGRWPHVHFEVYPSLSEATKAGTPTATSQLALPKATCDAVYATDGYEQSVRNLEQVSLASDMVFSDGYDQQVPQITGDTGDGYVATLKVPV
jgi:protocatechuate 3,4-dioxygenase beta subunit